MYDAASSILAQKLSQVHGVGQVIVGGSALPGGARGTESRAAQRITASVSSRSARCWPAQMSISPKGELANGSSAYLINDTDQLLQGEPIHAADRFVRQRRRRCVFPILAAVTDSVQDVRNAGVVDGKPAVLLIIFRQPGANIIDTVDRVHEPDAAAAGLDSRRRSSSRS